MKFLTREQVFEKMRSQGHVIFENDSRNYNLNIVGIRSKTAKLDEFGCQLLVAWKYRGQWYDRSYQITTYPGRRYMIEKLLNPRGCAILVPGQYRGIYSVRLHNGKYRALCQTHGPVKVFRDRDRDTQFDKDINTIMVGMFGINIHNSPDKQRTIRVGAYSAGCQVFAADDEFAAFMKIMDAAIEVFPENKFTYTLIDE
jgi:hypothetical protein